MIRDIGPAGRRARNLLSSRFVTAPRLKGSVIRARLTFVEELGGQAAVERVLARLPAEAAETLRTLLSASWYPFELGEQLDRAVVDELGGGRADFFLRIGADSAERNLHGVHKAFLRSDPHTFLAQVPTIYAFYYDRGHRTYERTGERSGVMTTHDAETFSAADCLTVVGWHVRALEMCGASGVRIVEEECRATGGRVCRYRLSWQAP